MEKEKSEMTSQNSVLQLGLQGKRILVTGGSRGIGAAAVESLTALGADVVFTWKNQGEQAAALASRLEARGWGGSAFPIQGDQRSSHDAQRVVAYAQDRLGGLDAFVANAGVWLPTPARGFHPETLTDVLETNLTGVLKWNDAVIPALAAAAKARGEKPGADLLFLSSTAGQRGEAGYGAYAATKGALIALVKSLAVELGPLGIRVNAVAPGWVDTDLSAPALRADPAQRQAIERIFPLGRIPEASDIAGPIAFLLSQWARSITGEILNVNAGTVLCG